MKKTGLVLLLALVVAAVTAAPAGAVTPLRPPPPPPDTDSVLILHGAFNYPGYWWDHTDLTVAVQAIPASTRRRWPRCTRRSPTGTPRWGRSSGD